MKLKNTLLLALLFGSATLVYQVHAMDEGTELFDENNSITSDDGSDNNSGDTMTQEEYEDRYGKDGSRFYQRTTRQNWNRFTRALGFGGHSVRSEASLTGSAGGTASLIGDSGINAANQQVSLADNAGDGLMRSFESIANDKLNGTITVEGARDQVGNRSYSDYLRTEARVGRERLENIDAAPIWEQADPGEYGSSADDLTEAVINATGGTFNPDADDILGSNRDWAEFNRQRQQQEAESFVNARVIKDGQETSVKKFRPSRTVGGDAYTVETGNGRKAFRNRQEAVNWINGGGDVGQKPSNEGDSYPPVDSPRIDSLAKPQGGGYESDLPTEEPLLDDYINNIPARVNESDDDLWGVVDGRVDADDSGDENDSGISDSEYTPDQTSYPSQPEGRRARGGGISRANKMRQNLRSENNSVANEPIFESPASLENREQNESGFPRSEDDLLQPLKGGDNENGYGVIRPFRNSGQKKTVSWGDLDGEGLEIAPSEGIREGRRAGSRGILKKSTSTVTPDDPTAGEYSNYVKYNRRKEPVYRDGAVIRYPKKAII